jgi:uncharacterized lipoprotein YmbA
MRAMRRPLVTVLLATAALLAGCGKGQQTAATRTVTVVASEQSKASGEQGSSKAQAFARAVNLRPSDVPGFRSKTKESSQKTPAEKRLGEELQHCVGTRSEKRPLLEESSLSFQRGASIAQQSVSSSVTVARSKAIAGEELKAMGSAHASSCLVKYLTGLFAGSSRSGAKIGPVKVAHGTPPAAGTAGSFGLRVSTSIIVRSVHVPFYLDLLGFVEGSSEVMLQTSGIPEPFPATAEQQLYTLLLERAKAHASEVQ